MIKKPEKTIGKYDIEKFWNNTKINYNRTYEGEFCMEWAGGKRGAGNRYGSVRFGKITGYAHRFSWLFSFGEIPDKKYVLHSCDNKMCINPNHLFLGTHEDNMKDKAKKGRFGEHIRKLKKEDVLEIRKMWESGDFFQHEIATKFSVTEVHIYNIINRRSWKKVD